MGNFVALADTDDPQDDQYHVAKVISVADGIVSLANYSTTTSNVNTATWKRLFQHRDGRYRSGGKASKHWQPVIDELDIDGEKDFPYIRHHRLQFTGNGHLTAACKRQLRQSGLRHHVLGRSFP